MSDYSSRLFANLGTHEAAHARKSDLARRYFLNPRVPHAVADDPDGSIHWDLQITEANGDPYLGQSGKGLKYKEPIPLILRTYQSDIVNNKETKRVLRCGRRTGKTFSMGVEVALEAITNPRAQILVLTPNEAQIKVIFDDNLRPLLRTYRHKNGAVGMKPAPDGKVQRGHDFGIKKDTQKPHEIVITDGHGHNVTIRGMVISNSARGQSATFVVVDEADYAKKGLIEGIVSPIFLTSPSTRALMASTPTGRRDSYYYKACTRKNLGWDETHLDFSVLPHYTAELHDAYAQEAGGEDSNTFVQEYLAGFGNATEGVFNQTALSKALICAPWIRLLENIDEARGTRPPKRISLRDTRDEAPPWEAVKPYTADGVDPHDPLGSTSVWHPSFPGVVTIGTDWNDLAGMQTVVVWWPPKSWLQQGKVRVARFPFDSEGEVMTTGRVKDRDNRAQEFVVGDDNGDPGGHHDLRNVEGIVIWHGRLESGKFTSNSAANRVASIMGIADFANAWYVDYGYGTQTIDQIVAIMETGEFVADGHLYPKAQAVPAPILGEMQKFHPDTGEETGKVFKAVKFGSTYEREGLAGVDRDDRTKDVLVSLTRRMLVEGKLLIPYGYLRRKAAPSELGTHTKATFNQSTGDYDYTEVPEVDPDIIEPTGGEELSSFGGLVAQMRAWRVAKVSQNARPIYDGADHAIDALMLALLAYDELYGPERVDSLSQSGRVVFETGTIEDVFSASAEATARTARPTSTATNHGPYQTRHYKSEAAALDALRAGEDPARVGTGLRDMVRQTREQYTST